jgi:DNA-binding MarR family transcriptional regulator
MSLKNKDLEPPNNPIVESHVPSPTFVDRVSIDSSEPARKEIPELGNLLEISVTRQRADFRVLQSLRRIIRSVEIHSRKLASTYKVTGHQLVCLLTVQEKGPLTATAIASEIHLSPSTVVGILDRLEEKRLIQRKRDRKDRRLVNVMITDLGERLVEQAPSPLQERLAQALSNLPELEQDTIARSLEKIVDLMEAGQIEAPPILEAGSEESPEQDTQ